MRTAIRVAEILAGQSDQSGGNKVSEYRNGNLSFRRSSDLVRAKITLDQFYAMGPMTIGHVGMAVPAQRIHTFGLGKTGEFTLAPGTITAMRKRFGELRCAEMPLRH